MGEEKKIYKEEIEKIDYLPIVMIDDGVAIEFEWIGEGLSGDYQEDDPEDYPHLRFSVYKIKDIKDIDPDPNISFEFGNCDTWEQVDDASYCTTIPIDTSQETLEMFLKILMIEYKEEVQNGYPVKKLGKRMSWINESWIERWFPIKS